MRKGLLKTHSYLSSAISRILDMVLILFAGFFSYWLRLGAHGFPLPPRYGALILIGMLLAAVVFPVFGVYRSWRARGLLAPAANVLGGWCVVFLVLMFLLVFSRQGGDFSRLWLGYWFGISGGLLVALRIMMFMVLRALRRSGRNQRHVIIIGCGPMAQDLVRRARKEVWAGFRVLAVFTNAPALSASEVEQVVQPLDGLADYLATHEVDEAWIAVPLEQTTRLHEILDVLADSTANVRFAPDLFGLFLLNHGVSDILDVPMIDLSIGPLYGFNRLLKVLEDRVLAALILILVSPLMWAIAIGVKLSSPGPVLFRQKRHGWNGHKIEVWKFRTMRIHQDPDGVTQCRRCDSRMTPFGAFLRRTRIRIEC